MTDGVVWAASSEVRPSETGLADIADVRTTPPFVSFDRAIHVLGALLDDMPEATLLGRAITGNLRVMHEPSRLAVLARLRSGNFAAAVFPLFDGRGLPTAPLIHQCAEEHSGVALFAICTSPPTRASALLAAARAGARVIVSPSVSELAAILRDLSRAAVHGVAMTRGRLHDVEPCFLRDVLAVATQTVGENGDVRTFAASLQVSTRTLSRKLGQAGLPSPRMLLAAARLLCASAEMECFPNRDAAMCARLSGFPNTRRMLRSARQYAVPIGGDREQPRFPRFSETLEAVVNALGGHLKTESQR